MVRLKMRCSRKLDGEQGDKDTVEFTLVHTNREGAPVEPNVHTANLSATMFLDGVNDDELAGMKRGDAFTITIERDEPTNSEEVTKE